MELCIPFVLESLAEHRRRSDKPFILGLNGVQGAGKTTLVTALHRVLTEPPHSLTTAVFSIDDIYLTHSAQQQLAASNPTNRLLQHRGEPSTHDLPLGLSLFSALLNKEDDVRIPVYDKSAFQGQGDRADLSTWHVVNKKGEKKVQVVLFEGWCVGFRPLSEEHLERKWRAAKEKEERGEGRGQLGKVELQDVRTINTSLEDYNALTDQFDALVHLDAEDTMYVYDWRLQSEAGLRAQRGTGMTDEQVIHFVNGYMPAYELFEDTLRSGIYGDAKGKQLRIVLGKDRKVVHSEII